MLDKLYSKYYIECSLYELDKPLRNTVSDQGPLFRYGTDCFVDRNNWFSMLSLLKVTNLEQQKNCKYVFSEHNISCVIYSSTLTNHITPYLPDKSSSSIISFQTFTYLPLYVCASECFLKHIISQMFGFWFLLCYQHTFFLFSSHEKLQLKIES